MLWGIGRSRLVEVVLPSACGEAERAEGCYLPFGLMQDRLSLVSNVMQDYKKVRVDWRASAGMRRDHFELALQHYMRIDGPSRDTCEGRIR